jgi:hypothetical protein
MALYSVLALLGFTWIRAALEMLLRGYERALYYEYWRLKSRSVVGGFFGRRAINR